MTYNLVPTRRSRRHFPAHLAVVLLALAAWSAVVPADPAHAAALASAPDPLFVPGEILVQFKPTVTGADRARIARAEGADVAMEIEGTNLVKLRVGPGDTAERAVGRFRQRPGVEYATLNARAQAFFVPNDTLIQTYEFAWNLPRVRAFEAWDIQTGDPDVVVAIVDTGVAYEDHAIPDNERIHLWPGTKQYSRSPDLPGPFIPGWDFVNNDAHADDDRGHGTEVATIVAGAPNNIAGSAGIAFGVTIMPIKVLDWQGDSEMALITAGIRYAVDHGANIVNLSLGFPPLDFFRAIGMTESEIRAMFRPLQDAVNYAQQHGVILVAAAGNFDAPEVSLPAGYPGVIAVGATDPDGRRASYSSYGKDIDLMAPGGDFGDLNHDHIQDAVFVLSIKPNRSEGSLAKPDSFGCFPFFGTSGASPHVAGAVALLMSQGTRSQGAIEQALRSTAIRPPDRLSQADFEYGDGLIQLDAALRAAKGLRGQSGQAAARGIVETRLLSPNPARGEASISYRTARTGHVRVRVFDVRGALVRSLDDRDAPAGEQRVRWDGRDDAGARVATGIYLFRIETSDGVATRKVALLR
jgi:serine protease